MPKFLNDILVGAGSKIGDFWEATNLSIESYGESHARISRTGSGYAFALMKDDINENVNNHGQNWEVSFDFNVDSGNASTHFGWAFNYQDYNDFYAVVIRDANTVRVQKQVGGTQSYPVSAVSTLNVAGNAIDIDDGWHNCRIQKSKNYIIVEIDGVTQIATTIESSLTYDYGRMGFTVYDNACEFKNFSIRRGAVQQLILGSGVDPGSSWNGIYDNDNLVLTDGSLTINPHRRGDYTENENTATATTFNSRLNIWSENEDHVTFGGAHTHMVSAWEGWKTWINNDSATAGTFYLYHTSSKTEFARFSGDGTSSFITGKFFVNGELEATSLDIDGNADISGTLNIHNEIITTAGGSLLEMYISSWTTASNHDILYQSWNTNTDDFIYLKSPGNSTNNHGIAFIGDNVIAFGRTQTETGNPELTSAAAPLNDNWLVLNSTGATFAGDVYLADSKYIKLGTGEDFEMHHNGVDTIIGNQTGNLKIRQFANDKDIIFDCDDGNGGVTEYFRLDGSAAEHNGTATTALYTNWPDNSRISVGSGNDLQLDHNGTDSIVRNETGDLYIMNKADDKDIIFQSDNGAGGVQDYIRLDGSAENIKVYKNMNFQDNDIIQVGTSGDLQIYHDGNHSYMSHGGTGKLFIQQNTNDQDIVFQCDDGSGGTTAYLTIAGADGHTVANKEINFLDSVECTFGHGSDLKIAHISGNNYITGTNGDLYIRNGSAADKDIIFQADNGSGGNAEYFRLDGSIGATIFPDNMSLGFGGSGDMYISHDGTITKIENHTGDLYINNKADNKDIIFQSDNGSGGLTTYLTLDGGFSVPYVALEDSAILALGTSKDLLITHDGTDSKIDNMNTGDLKIRNFADDKDIILMSDNGSGGVTAYITLDGSHTKTIMGKTVHFDDNVKIQMGNYASPDLEIYHDGSNSYINDTGTGDLLLRRGGAGGLNITGTGVIINGEADINGNADISGDLTLANSNKIVLNGGMGTAGNFDSTRIRLNSSNTVDTTGFQGIRFATSTADNYGWSFGANRSSNGRGSLRFYEHQNSNAGTERFTLLQDGNVGIGNSNPTSAKLVIREDSSYGLRLEDATGHYFRVNTGGDTEIRGDVTVDKIKGSTYSSNSFLDFDYDETASINNTTLASVARVNYIADTNGNDGATAVAHAFMTGTTDIDTATSLLTILNNGNATFVGNITANGNISGDHATNIGAINRVSTKEITINTNSNNASLKIADEQGGSVTIGKAESEVGGVGQNDATDVVIASNLTVTKKLLIQGELETETTTNTIIKDNVIQLNDGGTSGNTKDSGIVIHRGTSQNVAIVWDEDGQTAGGAFRFIATGDTAGSTDVSMTPQNENGENVIGGASALGFQDVFAAHFRAVGANGTSGFVGDGSGVTNLNMGNASSGTLAAVRGGTGLTSISTLLNSNVTSVSGNAGSVTNGVYTTGDQTIAGNKTFSGATSIGSTLASNEYSLVTIQGRNSHMFSFGGQSDHTLTLNCGSYYQAEVTITAHQTNGGTYNNIYIRGIWSNNHTSHHWDELERVGSMTGNTITITNGQNGSTTASGQLAIVHDNTQGDSFGLFTVNVIEHFGSSTHVIS